MREEILDLLQEYIEDGEKSVLFSTHVLSDLEQAADFIVFIDNGKILFKEAKDELIERYLLIKGDESKVSVELNKKLIGKTVGKYGFEAIIEADSAALFGNDFVYDKPTIDQIMLFFVKNGGDVYASN